jgi:glucoamylase
MPRDIPIGNGNLLINFDSAYQARDIYFPHVGKENQTLGGPNRFGLWSEGRFAWITDRAWQRALNYDGDTLVTLVTLRHPWLQVQLVCRDAVDFHENLWVRRIEVTNGADHEREFRLFFHHDFHILGNEVGDTAYYEPTRRAVLHYKERRWFLMNGVRVGAEPGVDQWACGMKELPGREGTWRDAEDGTLSGNPIAQGSVDSTIALHVAVAAGQAEVLYYWLCAGVNFEEVTALNRLVRQREPQSFVDRTSSYWQLWVDKDDYDFGMLPEGLIHAYKRSLVVLRTQIDNGGAILAANDSDITTFSRDTYSYVWPRDGALAAVALDLADQFGLSQNFFNFCAQVITKEGYFLHKYNADGSLASSWLPWYYAEHKELPIQEDETGLVLWALWKHFDKFRDVEFVKPLYRSLICLAADWMTSYMDLETQLPLPSWDLWEERRGIHAFTLGAVWAGLTAAANFADAFGEHDRAGKYRRAASNLKNATDKYLWQEQAKRFARMLSRRAEGEGFEIDQTIDASLYGLFVFGMYAPDDPKIVATMQAMHDQLWVKTDVGGLARYTDDYYQRVSQDIANVPGNPWFITTLGLAQWHVAKSKTQEDLKPALELLQWAAQHALPSGVMAEQLHPYEGTPLSVSPLTWSHAAFVMTALEYLDKSSELDLCPTCGNPRHYREMARLRREHEHHPLMLT